MARAAISAEVNPVQLAKFRKRVERWQGAPLATRASKGTVLAGDYMVPIIKRGIGRTKKSDVLRGRHGSASKGFKAGTLRKSVKSRKGRRGLFTDAFVGPTAPHKFFFIRGTGEHPLAPKREGRGKLLLLPAKGGRGLGNVNVRTASGVMHPGATDHPVVDEATQRHHGDAIRIINQMLFAE